MADDGVTCVPGIECATNPCAAISCLVGNTCDPVRGECVPNADCYHEIYITGDGVITSPGYPASYPPDQRCLWVLRAESRMIVTVISVDLEASADCVNDVIAVCASRTSLEVFMHIHQNENKQRDEVIASVFAEMLKFT